MKAFEIAIPSTLESATKLLAEGTEGRGPEARERTRIIAGGQDLLGELKDHLVEPERLVDLKRLPGLGEIEVQPDGDLSIGALVTITELERHAGRVEFATSFAAIILSAVLAGFVALSGWTAYFHSLDSAPF